ncbi:MAG TPA: gliding motility-associated C-terminal domain-containing protein, partial [Flavobacteriales bacterium]
VDVSVSTQYWVTVSDSCWAFDVTDSAWVILPVPDPLVVTLPTDTVIPCLWTADLVPVVTGAMGEVTYEWTEGLNVVGTDDTLTVPAGLGVIYTVEVTDECQRTEQASITVFTGPTPPLSLVAEGDTVMCAGMPMVLQVLSVTGGGGNYHYQWNLPPGSGPNDAASVEVEVEDDTFFTVTVTDDCGNSADTTLAAVVLDHPPITLTLANDTAVCPDELVPLWVLAEGGAGGYAIEWAGIGSGTPLVWTAGDQSITARVTVTDLCGVEATGTVNVDVFPADASIDADQLSETQWRFNAVTVPQMGVDIDWDLGDGNTSNDPSVLHNYTDYEAHWVVLRVETPEGCVRWDSVLTRPPSATIYFPNTFTPDGDGLNDQFGGVGRLIDEYELWVFDRWGRIAFHSTDINHRWNGFIDGEEAKSEVYSYRYRAAGVSMLRQEGFGHITLLR